MENFEYVELTHKDLRQLEEIAMTLKKQAQAMTLTLGHTSPAVSWISNLATELDGWVNLRKRKIDDKKEAHFASVSKGGE